MRSSRSRTRKRAWRPSSRNASRASRINNTALVLLAAHILSMVGFSTYAALLPELRDLWSLSNSQAGIVGGMFFAGYIATVPLWTALTDRVDGRKVYLAGGVLSAAGSAGFGLAASGFASAVFFQCLLGVGIAATYMPGLRLLSDRISGPGQSRYIAFYTSFFGIGTALSLLIAGGLAPVVGWQWAFVVSAFGPLAAAALVCFGIAAMPPKVQRQGLSLADLFPVAAWRKVLANRPAAGYTFGYFAHCLELFGSRAWMVAFLVFSASFQSGGFPWAAAAIAAAVNLASVPASIVGNEIALRIGRRRWILIAMAGSSLSGLALGVSAPWHWALVLALLVVYSMLVMAESATLTAGLVAAAPAELRGAAMGLYSLIGFGGGMLGPVLFGAALDVAGGAASPIAWVAGYAAIGAGCLLAPLVGRMNRRTL
ncbi:MAG TPA: MFS transporter [Burkholderiales bacterium]